MKSIRSKFFGSAAVLTAAAIIILTSAACSNENKNGQASDKKAVSQITDGVIFHAWCQSFNTIKESMPDIAYAGFTAIQTSPINECVVGGNGGMQLNGEGKWYYHYQPTDWVIGNYQLGTKDEFSAMCEEAHKYGIKVIVDVVPNHTTPDLESVGQGLIDAVGGIDKLYHANGKNEIVNWSDRLECTTGQMGGLPDVNTENKDFQDYFIKYLNECIACGADGFRYDTAKHIGLPSDPVDPNSDKNNFWERVTSEINEADRIFNYGEVLQGDGEKIEEYQKAVGGTTASGYGEAVRNAVTSRKLSAAALTDLKINTEDPTAVTWVESHDNYCNDGTSSSLSDKQVILGWAIIAARENGTPLFFDRPYGNTAGNMWGAMNRIGAMGNPFYKDDTVTEVNRFRTAMTGEAEKLSNADADESVLLIERGSKGLVIVNGGRYSYTLNNPVSLPDGKYVDRISGETEFTVENGTLSGLVFAESAVVLYNEGYVEKERLGAMSVDAESFILTENEPVTVTLRAENAGNTFFSVDNGEYKTFSDGDKLEIGGGTENGKPVKLTLKSEDGKGNVLSVMSWYFTVQGKRSVEAGTTVYFQKPDDWKDSVSAYVYDESTGTVRQAAPWPGVPCELGGDGLYSYTFDESWDNVLIIFTDGSNQIPGAMEPGLVVEADKVYSVG